MGKFFTVPLPSCQKCAKPATDEVFGPYNVSYGVFCKKHAEEHKRYLEEGK